MCLRSISHGEEMKSTSERCTPVGASLQWSRICLRKNKKENEFSFRYRQEQVPMDSLWKWSSPRRWTAEVLHILLLGEDKIHNALDLKIETNLR